MDLLIVPEIESQDANGSSCDADSSESTPSASGQDPTVCSESTAQKARTRKGHTKSRRGCFNCKKRKIKCQETRPACGHCSKAGLLCEYPATAGLKIQRNPPYPQSPQQLVQLQSTPTQFTLSDMRLFHHFIVRAYPHLPLGADQTWISIIPAFAHHYDFLIHAMLALSASHLNVTTDEDHSSAALSHRVTAVNRLNASLINPAPSRSEKDARVAACLALAFQSSYLEDGLLEMFTMIRGCYLIGGLSSVNQDPTSAFHTFSQENHIAIMMKRLEAANEFAVNTDALNGAMASIEKMRPLLRTDFEKRFHQLLFHSIDRAYSSYQDSYKAFAVLHSAFAVISDPDFRTFVSPDNGVARLLIGHFLAIHLVLEDICSFEWEGREPPKSWDKVTIWMAAINDGLSPSLREYFSWPMAILALYQQQPFGLFRGRRNESGDRRVQKLRTPIENGEEPSGAELMLLGMAHMVH